MTLDEYVDSMGDARLVIDMSVGALQRLMIYPEQGFMISQPVPADVAGAYERLCQAGFTSRLLTTDASSARPGQERELLRVSLPHQGTRLRSAPPGLRRRAPTRGQDRRP